MTEREFYFDYLNHFPISEEKRSFLTENGKVLFDCCEEELKSLVDSFFSNDFNIEKTKEAREKLAQKTGVPFYMVNFIFLVSSANRTKKEYEKRGFSEQLFYDTFGDLLVKADECKAVKGIYGNFVESWYPIFYRLKIFRLGRLEYEIGSFQNNYEKNGFQLHRGDPVIYVHIPSGQPLTRESREESYRLAYDFFRDCRIADNLYFTCESWLLYSPMHDILPQNSNIRDFMEDWDIYQSVNDVHFYQAWRIYSVNYDGNPDHLPQNNSLQRALAQWLKNGGRLGTGFGVIIYNGKERMN